MIAALFLIETAKSELEEAGLPQAEAVSKASDKLTETTEKIADVLSNASGNSQAKRKLRLQPLPSWCATWAKAGAFAYA